MAKAPIVTFSISKKVKEELETIAAKRHISTSELIREYIKKGMSVDKSVDDIDFIRLQIREELQIITEKQTNRIIGLIMRVGIVTAMMCKFTKDIIYHAVPLPKQVDNKQLMEAARKDAVAYMTNRSETAENAVDNLLNTDKNRS
ncbi:MAG: ribbon-helix-helix domain-containing protein [Clostridiales bacterium]|jgi:antitoxin component of RelBE/YafQ-DinJ toxin-antitoxin module|nr:ribbon-helix-helix domain-containing protein [Clostridiales bacterium]